MVLARARLAMTRSGSAENRPDAMACNTFGWTPVASTNRTALSSQRLSTPCFAGTVMRLNATSISQMFRDLPSTPTTSPTSCPGNRHFGKADGSLGAGPFKSLLLRHQLNSSPKTGEQLGNKSIPGATYLRDNGNSRQSSSRKPSV